MSDLDESALHDIRESIDAELSASSKELVFTVDSCTQLGNLWQVCIRDDDASKGGLDEALEGNRAWWIDPVRGAADVLSVAPDQLLINLRFATTAPPAKGKVIFIYPPRFL